MHYWSTTSRHSAGGFTLLEMVVSLGILTIVVLIGVGSLLTIVDSNRKAQAEKSVMNNLQFAVDSMTRTMRVGTTYHCGSSGDLGKVADCAVSGANAMTFESSNGDPGTTEDQVVYRLVGTTLERSTDGGANYIAVTAPEVIIDTLTFYVDGAEVTNSQPRVLIVIQGHVGEADKERTDFSIETLVSQRALE